MVNPFLGKTVIRPSFVQKCISQPSDVRLGQFKVRRTLLCVLWTCILIFVTWSDSPVPVWQSPWPNVVLKNDSILGNFDQNGSILTICRFFFHIEEGYVFLSLYSVPVQVLAFKINSQCQCDTFQKSVFRLIMLYFLAFFYAWHPYTPLNARYGQTNRPYFI